MRPITLPRLSAADLTAMGRHHRGGQCHLRLVCWPDALSRACVAIGCTAAVALTKHNHD